MSALRENNGQVRVVLSIGPTVKEGVILDIRPSGAVFSAGTLAG